MFSRLEQGLIARLPPRLMLIALALAASLVAMALAAAAAQERAGQGLDRRLATAAALLLALGAQLLPALSRRHTVAWLLWPGCLVATLYGHAHFFAASNQRAGDLRAVAVLESGQMQAWRTELAGLHGRPLVAVAADQARLESRWAQAQAGWQRCEKQSPGDCFKVASSAATARAQTQANTTELNQAQRAAWLQQQISAAAADTDRARRLAQYNAVDQYLAEVTGLPLAAFHLASSLGQSLLVELLSALLWVMALKQSPTQAERSSTPFSWLSHATHAPPAVPPEAPAQSRLFDDRAASTKAPPHSDSRSPDSPGGRRMNPMLPARAHLGIATAESRQGNRGALQPSLFEAG
jgi:hypothetical protein